MSLGVTRAEDSFKKHINPLVMTMPNTNLLRSGHPLNRAVVYDEQQMMAEGLKAILLQTGRFDHVVTITDMEDILPELNNNSYNYLFIDAANGDDFKELVKRIKSSRPNFIIIVVTSVHDIHIAKMAFEAGVNGYVSKYVGSAELKTAIKKSQLGEKYISSDFTQKIAITATGAEPSTSLTRREVEIMNFVAQGFTIAKTASMLHLSHHTIITHRRNIMQKLNIHSAVEIAKYAISNKYLTV